jgi:hypothetical protein
MKTEKQLPDGLVDPDALPEDRSRSIASAISFLLDLSSQAGSFVHRDDGRSLFIIRDPDATKKFLALYSKTFTNGL